MFHTIESWFGFFIRKLEGKNPKLFPVLLTIVSVLIFSILIYQKQPDIRDHIDNSLGLINGKPLTGNFLFYFLIGLMALWKPSFIWVAINAVIVLTGSVLAKYYLSLWYLKRNLGDKGNKIIYLAFLSFAICITMNLPNRPSFTWLIGQFSPNLWHNSTTIFLMPISLIIFFKALKFLRAEDNTLKDLVILSCLVPLSMLIKPSFFFVFGPAFGLIILRKYGLRKKFWIGLIPIIAGFTLLILQTLQIYFYYPYHQEAGFRIDPFFVWNNWSYFIPISILVSIAFPLGVSIVYFKEIKSKLEFQFSWLMLFIGLIIYSVMAENGPFWIQVSNNFGWQLYIVNFILFLISVDLLFKKSLVSDELPFWIKLLWLIFIAHFLIGILYLVKTPLVGYR
jgi:hypothetical protein